MHTMQVVLLQTDAPTLNGRVYPRDVVEKAVANAATRVQEGRMLVYPYSNDATPLLSSAVGVVRMLELVDNRVMAVIELFDAPTVGMRFAPFGFASLLQEIVQPDYTLKGVHMAPTEDVA